MCRSTSAISRLSSVSPRSGSGRRPWPPLRRRTASCAGAIKTASRARGHSSKAGGVRPAHYNAYGFTVGLPVWRGGAILFDGDQVRSRGNVNGNVLVPAPGERTPLATDPDRRAYVQRLLDAYPKELPNRTDINPRALNTNDHQAINNDRGSIRLRQSAGKADDLALHYSFTGQQVDAFQLVGGQNPDTTTKKPCRSGHLESHLVGGYNE